MNSYKVLNKQKFHTEAYSIVPIRYEDRLDIMRWRNEQIYHLRQAKPLTESDQENYFQNVVAKLFEQAQPNQILFSYLENGVCIGYGGLVHISWIDKNAEISFVVNTELEQKYFHKHWGIYLGLIEQVAFETLNLHKIYTYAFDLRPHLYKALETAGYNKEAILKEQCCFEGAFKDVAIHSKINRKINIRKANEGDKQITFQWANDTVTRGNSFNSEQITLENHYLWFDKKLQDVNADYYICEVNEKPAGFVRFDTKGFDTTIGILIDKEYRGKGLAPIFIGKCCEKFRKRSANTIWAYIKENNKASIKSFEKAGFLFIEEVGIKGKKAVKYKLD